MVYAVVLQQKFRDPDKYAEYVRLVRPMIQRYDGEIAAADHEPVILEGAEGIKRVVILTFPSEARVMEWYRSPEYQAIIPLRTESVDSDILIAHGFSEGASAVAK